jgi:hypothetical protein
VSNKAFDRDRAEEPRTASKDAFGGYRERSQVIVKRSIPYEEKEIVQGQSQMWRLTKRDSRRTKSRVKRSVQKREGRRTKDGVKRSVRQRERAEERRAESNEV